MMTQQERDADMMAWAAKTLERAVWWLDRMDDGGSELEREGFASMIQWYEHWMYGTPAPKVVDEDDD